MIQVDENIGLKKFASIVGMSRDGLYAIFRKELIPIMYQFKRYHIRKQCAFDYARDVLQVSQEVLDTIENTN